MGIDNDLWIIKRDGSGAELIYRAKLNHAALHQPDGKTIIFSAARTRTGQREPQMEKPFFVSSPAKNKTPSNTMKELQFRIRRNRRLGLGIGNR